MLLEMVRDLLDGSGGDGGSRASGLHETSNRRRRWGSGLKAGIIDRVNNVVGQRKPRGKSGRLKAKTGVSKAANTVE